MSPTGMLERLEKDIAARNKALQDMPYDLLRDKDGLNLREYQLKAIQAAENAILNGQQNVLLAMATGTGKTRTILGMIYRFLKTGRFRRILFLVDRTSLGEQASDVFKEVKLEDLMTLDDIYNIKGLEDKAIDRETRIQVATVQSMVKRILYNDEDTTKAAALWTLKTVLSNALKLLHPYMPFITEEIYCTLCPEEESIMISAWPEFTEEWDLSLIHI